MKGLGRLEAAAEVGVTLLKYRDLLIEVKAVVNEAKRIMPVCELRSLLSEAMDAYEAAGDAWERDIRLRTDSGKDPDGGLQTNWALGKAKLGAARKLQ